MSSTIEHIRVASKNGDGKAATYLETEDGRRYYDDPRMVYIPRFVVGADRVYETLFRELPWERYIWKMYGKSGLVPRDEVWVSNFGYYYNRRYYPPFPGGWDAVPQALHDLRTAVEAETGARYNSVLLNLYRDGKDKVDAHCDCEETMDDASPIAGVSLGAARKFQWRRIWNKKVYPASQRKPAGPLHSIVLAGGSLLVMPPGMQDHWFHMVPREPRVTGPRINLTFRWINGVAQSVSDIGDAR